MSRMPEIYAQISRTGELYKELEVEYDRCLEARTVSTKLRMLTHEMFEKIANILDQVFHLAWERRVKPRLPPDRHNPKGYFVCGRDDKAFKAGLRRWYAEDLEAYDGEFYNLIVKYQPYRDLEAHWILAARNIARHKHIRLLPQIVIDQARQTLDTPFGRVTRWEIDPSQIKNQLVVIGAPAKRTVKSVRRSKHVVSRDEVWSSLEIDGFGVDPKVHGALYIHFLAALVQNFEQHLKL
jgi:hypothetical protein